MPQRGNTAAIRRRKKKNSAAIITVCVIALFAVLAAAVMTLLFYKPQFRPDEHPLQSGDMSNVIFTDAEGNVVELHCTADLDSKTGGKTAGRKVKGTIHWVAEKTALPAEVRLYDYLIETDENGNVPKDFIAALNKDSLEVIDNAWIEPSVKLTAAGTHYQFLRVGYFVVDPDTTPDHIVFNRVVGLRDSWAKVNK